MKKSIYLTFALLMAACATSDKLNAISIGMTKKEVIAEMGTPTSTSAQGSAEYLTYKLSENMDQAYYGIKQPYFVRLINGKVESYGKIGDFDSANNPETRQHITIENR